MTKYIVVAGGVTSGVGKDISTAAIGKIPKLRSSPSPLFLGLVDACLGKTA